MDKSNRKSGFTHEIYRNKQYFNTSISIQFFSLNTFYYYYKYCWHIYEYPVTLITALIKRNPVTALIKTLH